ncbi:MAG TPA: DUF6364 family protein [Chitinophagaceae bacterium]|nr:DUF6364 family protein [Chitinophagaceae bacterium]
MKTKLTLTIDAALMEDINKKAKLNKSINLSQMVERFLYQEFKPEQGKTKSTVKSLRGILRETETIKNWKQEKINRLSKKHLR